MAADFLMEERKEEFLVYPTGGDRRESHDTAHFLKPFVDSIDGAVAAPSFDSLSFSTHSSGLTTNLIAYSLRTKKWKAWVDTMKCKHRSTWERAGIRDAIMGSTITIHRHKDLMLGFLEKWCPATNSFVFPWGEATVTLEDVAVLGGYSVLGEWALSSHEDEETQEILKKLDCARRSFFATKARKPNHAGWMDKFMGSQSEIEHQAFLVYWLSRFVFPSKFDSVDKNMLPIAARLASGAKIALAPAVLATIYKNLSLWKAAEIAARKSGAKEGPVEEFTVLGLLPLVQVWIWVRFPSLRPNPKSIQLNEPRLARWDNLKKLKIENLSGIINSAGEEFLWRPYASEAGGSVFLSNIQQEDHGYWVIVDSDMDENLQVFIRCLRASELVGLKAECIEQYLPHRVGMQFGLDQSIPGHVSRVHANPKIAWNDYIRPINDAQVYVPARQYKPRCTTGYLNWWKKLYLGWSETVETRCPGKNTSGFVRPKVEELNLASVKLEVDLPPPPGFSPKNKGEKVMDSAPLQDGRDSTTSFTGQEAAPKESAPTSPGCRKISTPKSSRRKILDGSSCRKISDFYAPISSPCVSAAKKSRTEGPHSRSESKLTTQQLSSTASFQSMDKHHNKDEEKDNLSSTADNVNVEDKDVDDEPIDSEAKETEAKEVTDRRDVKKLGTSQEEGQRQSINVMPPELAQLEARISILEKWCDLLKSSRDITNASDA